jgi:hypothetical protein
VAGPSVFVITSSIPLAFKKAVITPISTALTNTAESILTWIFDLIDFITAIFLSIDGILDKIERPSSKVAGIYFLHMLYNNIICLEIQYAFFYAFYRMHTKRAGAACFGVCNPGIFV